MLKEIDEQPRALTDTLRGRAGPETGGRCSTGSRLDDELWRVARMWPAARPGTPALVGKYMIEALARLPCEVDMARSSATASRCWAREPGDRASPRAAKRRIRWRRCGRPRAAAPGARRSSTWWVRQAARDADGGAVHPRRPGDRRGLTKAFTAQLTALTCWRSSSAAGARTLSSPSGGASDRARARGCPARSRGRARSRSAIYAELAERYRRAADVFFLGRGTELPGRARGRAQAQGDQLHPRRGLPGRRDEARPDRAASTRRCPVVCWPPRTVYEKMVSNIAGGAGARRRR